MGIKGITYTQVAKAEHLEVIVVRLAGALAGHIRREGLNTGGWRYYPKGVLTAADAGELFPTLEACKASLETGPDDTETDVQERDKLNQIEDILVNQYGEENEPLGETELRRILDSIVAVVESDKQK